MQYRTILSRLGLAAVMVQIEVVMAICYPYSYAAMAEWLRRLTRNQMGLPA